MINTHIPGVADEAAVSPILILGSQRSGTTWLAKIVDSHPDVLYRHEPDETILSPSPMTPAALPGLLHRWISCRDPRTVSIRPFFHKTWQPSWANQVRAGLAAVMVLFPTLLLGMWALTRDKPKK